MDLVTDHVLQPLIVGRIEEDHDFHAFPGEAVVHDLIAIALVAEIMQLVRDVLDRLALERRCIALVAVETGHFAQDGLDQVTDGHARWDGVWVHDHVGNDTLDCEGQVFLPVGHSAGSLLSVPTGELVSDLGNLDRAHLNFDQAAAIFVRSERDLVNVAFLGVLERH